jgi:Oxidoreductase family, NAD-binding Rossmann fold
MLTRLAPRDRRQPGRAGECERLGHTDDHALVRFPPTRVPALRGGPTLRWGIVAPGQIADDFAATVLANTDQPIHAVASRSAQRSQTFAARHRIDRAYQGYERLLDDPSVDIVYVAAPHAEHHRLALAAIAAGKHVLVEKPFTVSGPGDRGRRGVTGAWSVRGRGDVDALPASVRRPRAGHETR